MGTAHGRREDMTGSAGGKSIVDELRRALQDLYDPVALRRSPLLNLLDVEQKPNPQATLQRLLLDAIEALKPAAAVPLQSGAWRVYQVLSSRYVEQFSQREVATDLALSTRQLRRQEREAVQALADYLVGHHGLRLHESSLCAVPGDDEENTAPGDQAPSREQEIEWLRRSVPTEPVDAAEVAKEVLRTVSPLLQALSVRAECDFPPTLPRLAVQLTIMRQALLNVLTAAVRSTPHGRVQLLAQVHGHEVHIRVQSAARCAGMPLQGESAECLEMARQLLEISGGTLVVTSDDRGRPALNALLVLPAAGQVVVLAIDDNADTLRLFERYLSGTRYRLLGAPDPEQALALVERLRPDIVVVDVMLPAVDGWEVLGRLREHPSTRGVPLMVCTILPQEHLALTLGAAAFLRKPVSRRAFLTALDHLRGLPAREL